MPTHTNKPTRKPREQHITLDFGGAVPKNSFMLDKRTGRFALFNNGRPVQPIEAVVESGYQRAKGFKPLVRATLSSRRLYGHPNRALEHYDLILAVDTNTKTIDRTTISVTSVVVARQTRLIIPGNTSVQFRADQCFEFRNPTEKPELIGWKTVIEMLQQNPSYHSTTKTVMIVDSELDKIKDYNNRGLPISQGFYLPRNFTLVYASSDSPSESVANRLLKVADATASMVLRQILQHKDGANLSLVENRPYSHFRIWNAATSPATQTHRQRLEPTDEAKP